ncbi:hypothetical protein ONS95_009200 [Cadophora gregata]|uniref:uncharacterized protein n=1 Tax=Cadophora gregata TaxID=51156 RepID=UPI0026DC4740|nr:uncharacterized protein ONS95_009200 [Cadophora gregata]KAK0124224.1 hypothetical protein ONS95_009200 [Cadophora gregata]
MAESDTDIEALLGQWDLSYVVEPPPLPKIHRQQKSNQYTIASEDPLHVYRERSGKNVIPFPSSSRELPPTPERHVRRGSWGIDPAGKTARPSGFTYPLDNTEAAQINKTTVQDSKSSQDSFADRWERRGSFGIDPVEIPAGRRRCCYGLGGQHTRACVYTTPVKPTDSFTQAGIRSAMMTEPGTKSIGLQGLPPYHYKPLPSTRSIRLVRVLGFGQDGLDKLIVKCMIETHNLDSMPPYQALSYTWASPMYDESDRTYPAQGGEEVAFHGEEIELDGSSFAISDNLFSALLWLAETKMQGYIWADAICIDQVNMVEKAIQISLMGGIYSSAKNVIVWLGSECSDLFDFADARKTLSKALSNLEVKNEATVQNPLDPIFLKMIGVELAEDWIEMWQKYFQFFQRRRWFRRAWIVQEVALARDLTFQCGEKTILWKDVYALGLLLRDSGWRHSLAEGMDSNPRGGIGDEADRLLEYRDQVLHGGPRDPKFANLFAAANGASTDIELWFSYLQYMIQEIRRYQASNMKDKIYAVLGLVKGFLPNGSAEHITPDYSLPLPDIYTSVTMSILIELPILSCLSYVGSKPSGMTSLSLPSWVPDYRAALGRVPIIHLGNHTCFNVSNIHMAKPAIRRFRGHTLEVQGRLVDTVTDFSIPLNDMRSSCYVIRCIDMCLKLSSIYRTGEDRVEVLWRTLIADTTERPPIQHPAPAEYSDHFHDWMLTLMVRWFLDWEHQPKSRQFQMDAIEQLATNSPSSALPTREELEESFNLALETTDSAQSDARSDPPLMRRPLSEVKERSRKLQQFVSPNLRSSKGFYLFDRAAKEVRSNRRLFRTTGGYIGLAPVDVDYGDALYILDGARVPFLLRKNRLVGEAYVHGIMHGELSFTDEMTTVQIA